MDLQRYILLKLDPVMVICCFIGQGTLMLQSNGIYRNLNRIQKFTNRLAARDYSGEHLLVTSRDNLWLLINDMNSFADATHGALKSFSDSVKTSTASAEALGANMTETSASVTQIIVNIESVKNMEALFLHCCATLHICGKSGIFILLYHYITAVNAGGSWTDGL